MTTTAPPQLASFALLREVAQATEGIRDLIRARAEQVAGADWDIVPTREASEAYRHLLASMHDFAARRKPAVRFFMRPDPDYRTLAAWLERLMEDLLVIDAVAVTSDLRLLDGATIEPQVDKYGRLTGYQQYLTGIPRRDLAEIAAGPPPDCEPFRSYESGKLVYLAMTRRTWTPFGYSPLERALVRNEHGDIDRDATLEHLIRIADDRWMTTCKAFLRESLFNPALARFGDDLCWEWETG